MKKRYNNKTRSCCNELFCGEVPHFFTPVTKKQLTFHLRRHLLWKNIPAALPHVCVSTTLSVVLLATGPLDQERLVNQC